jgi:hypothetical protein
MRKYSPACPVNLNETAPAPGRETAATADAMAPLSRNSAYTPAPADSSERGELMNPLSWIVTCGIISACE